MWKLRFNFNAEPKRWIAVTAPQRPSRRPVAASSHRRFHGTMSPNCRVATCGITRSTQWAAFSAIRRPAHDGQNPRVLQENNTRRSWSHPRYARNSRSTNHGRVRSTSRSAPTRPA